MGKAMGFVGVFFSLILLFNPATSYSLTTNFSDTFSGSQFGIVPEAGPMGKTPPLIPQTFPFSANQEVLIPESIRDIPQFTFYGFEEMIHEATGLPYDIIRADTLNVVDPKVSGTEIGLRILELVAQRDFYVHGFQVGEHPERAEEAMRLVLSSLEQMEKAEVSKVLNGETITAKFFYTFSDSRTLEGGLYGGRPEVGFFDNGNLAVALAVASQAFKGTDIETRSKALLDDMDFRFFLNPDGKTFRLGYYPDSDTFTPWSLGQWGSEGILSVFLTVFKDGVNEEAFSRLLSLSPAREYTTSEGEVIKTIPGYAGNMYVKLFPLLFFGIENTHPAILEDARRYVQVHIEEAKKNSLPIWGWSSSSTVDGGYSEFGVRGISQFGNPSIDQVTPHASFLVLGALMGFEPAQEELLAVMDNFLAMVDLNPDALNSSRGFVDVIDPQSGQVGPHLISLDKGMEAISIFNFIMRQRGQQGIDKYFWDYLADLGKKEEAKNLLDKVGKEMAEMIEVQAPREEPALEDLDLIPLSQFGGPLRNWAHGAATSSVTTYDDPEKGEVWRIDYNVRRDFSGASIALSGTEPMGNYDYLVIEVRGLPESEGGQGFTDIFKVELKPEADQHPFPFYDITGVSDEWKTVLIKIPDDFAGLDPEIDLQKALGEFTIVFEDWKATDKVGTILIGDIYLAKEKAETQAAPPEEPTPPAIPTSLSVDEITSEEIKLSWADVEEATGYTVWVEGETVEYSKKFDASTNSLTLNVEEAGLIPAETYNFKVSAYQVFPGGGVLESEWSQLVSFTIPEERGEPSELSPEQRQAIEATTAFKSIKIWARQEEIRRKGITLDEDKLVEDLAEIEPGVKEGVEPLIEQLAEALNRQGIEVEVKSVSKGHGDITNFFQSINELPFIMELKEENPLGDKGYIVTTKVYSRWALNWGWPPIREDDVIDYINSEGESRSPVDPENYKDEWRGYEQDSVKYGYVLHLKTEAPPEVDLKILEERTSMGFFTDGALGSGYESWTDEPERGEVLQIEYDVSDGARWSGLYVKLPNLNISGYNKLNIGIKGSTQGIPGRVKIELKRNRETIWSTTVSGFTLDWKDFSISMPSNLGRIDEVTVVFSYGMGGDLKGIIYIDPNNFGFLK